MAAGTPTLATKAVPTRWQDLILPVGIIASVLVIMVPMPPALMDVLLSAKSRWR